jgi:hypothetical protein
MLPAKRIKRLRILFVEAFLIWFVGFIVTGLLGVSLLVDCFQRATSSQSKILFYCILALVLTLSIASIGNNTTTCHNYHYYY